MLVVDGDDATTSRYDFTNARFLLEERAISYAGSANLLSPSLQRPRAPSRGVLAIGNPSFGGARDDRELAEQLSAAFTYEKW